MDVNRQKEKERLFREQDTPFEIFTVQTKTKWWSLIELENVFNALAMKNGESILDVGCSDGRLLEFIYRKLPESRLFGVDFAQNPLKVLQQKNFKSAAVCSDISHLPFGLESFDHAASIQTIQQIPSREERLRVLQNIFNVLKNNGTFVLTVLNQKAWFNLVENGKEGQLSTSQDLYVYLYEYADLKEDLESVGFIVRDIKGINIFPVRWLKRLGLIAVLFDQIMSNMLKPLSFQKGRYLLALCRKK